MKFRRILVAPTAFKGTLSPFEAADVISSVLKKNSQTQVTNLPLADGGDGTLDVIARALNGRVRENWVKGPLGKKVKAQWAVVNRTPLGRGKTAVIEMARASGLALVKGKKKPLDASSYGTGELIRFALDEGCRTILMGVGGTASSDGGAGALAALGLSYQDKHNRPLASDIPSLLRLGKIDWTRFDARLKTTRIYILCDVTNPLLGPRGSARTFSPQKGANAQQVELIEKLLTRWSRFAKHDTKKIPGAGAAGALAFGLSGFAGAKLVEGAPFIMRLLNWKKHARLADLIVSGEGRLDRTSLGGKVIGSIHAQSPSKKIAAICGRCDLSKAERQRTGIDFVVEMGDKGLRNSRSELRRAALRLKALLSEEAPEI